MTGPTEPSPPGDARRARALALLLLVPWALLTRRYWFLCDDAFISFRYARNWANGHGPRYNITGSEAPVEGYSNFLWTATAALAHRVGLDMRVVMPVLSAACAAVLLLLVFRTLREHLRLDTKVAWASALSLACFPPFAVWSSSGLETMSESLFLFTTWAALALGRRDDRDPWIAGVAALLLALSRPEGLAWVFVIVVVAAVHRGLDGRPVGRPIATALAVLVPVYAAYFAWRWQYYGTFVANTAYAKVHVEPATLARGAQYVGLYIATEIMPLFLPLAVLVGLKRERTPGQASRWVALSAGTLAIAVPTYAVVISGDYMAWFRALVPGAAFLPIVFAVAITRLTAVPARQAMVALFIAVIGLLPAMDRYLTPPRLRQALDIREKLPIFRTENQQWFAMVEHTRAWREKGLALKENTQPGDAIVAAAIGNLGFYSDLFVYDRNGLVTREVAALPWNGELRSPGHDKTVMPEFFLPQRPEVLDAKLLYGPRIPLKIRFAMREMRGAEFRDEGYYPDIVALPPEPMTRLPRALIMIRHGDTTELVDAKWAQYQDRMKGVADPVEGDGEGVE